MSAQIETLIAQLQAEREHASMVWTILNELRLHSLLPEWAKALDAGTMRQADKLSSTRREVNATLAALIPGFEQVARAAVPAATFDKSIL